MRSWSAARAPFVLRRLRALARNRGVGLLAESICAVLLLSLAVAGRAPGDVGRMGSAAASAVAISAAVAAYLVKANQEVWRSAERAAACRRYATASVILIGVGAAAFDPLPIGEALAFSSVGLAMITMGFLSGGARRSHGDLRGLVVAGLSGLLVVSIAIAQSTEAVAATICPWPSDAVLHFVEGESATDVFGGARIDQEMRGFAGHWSNGRQLLVDASREGAAVGISFDIERSEEVCIAVRLSGASDYGLVEVSLDSRQLALVDTFSERVVPVGWRIWSAREMPTGVHRLGLKVVGKSSKSDGFKLGLDAIAVVRPTRGRCE